MLNLMRPFTGTFWQYLWPNLLLYSVPLVVLELFDVPTELWGATLIFATPIILVAVTAWSTVEYFVIRRILWRNQIK